VRLCGGHPGYLLSNRCRSRCGWACRAQCSLSGFDRSGPLIKQRINSVMCLIISQIHKYADPSCVYPQYSTPACVNGNPCGFQCTDGFTAFPVDNPTACICESPSVICNGFCVESSVCSSPQPADDRRRWVGSGSCAGKGKKWVTCGVYGGGPLAWECINTEHDLESCESIHLFCVGRAVYLCRITAHVYTQTMMIE
jgi:hypothetical protein